MCYKVPLLWTHCNHTYGYSPIHCTAAKALNLKPTEHCEHLMDAEDPNWKIKKDSLCPECQVTPTEVGESSMQAAAAAQDQGQENEKTIDEEERRIAAELAHLESLLEEHELSDYETALQDSLHHHTLQHEAHLEQARLASLADAPEHHLNPQSLETYMSDVARAREESQRHWEDVLGMGVYRDHERAVQRARVESYRELLEGYRPAKEGKGNGGSEVDEDDEKNGEGVGESSGSTSSMSTTKATAGSSNRGDKRRWPFQDDVEDNKETVNDSRAKMLSSRQFSTLATRSFREDSREGVAPDPAESFAERRTRSHASQDVQQHGVHFDGETSTRDDRGPVDDGDGGREQRRRRSMLKMFRHGGGGGSVKKR